MPVAWSGECAQGKAASLSIVETAVQAGSFETLVAAVKAAGLAETLSGEGPFTVFAPTDEAFAKLPAGTVEALLQDTDKLTQILTYHVVPGSVMAGEVLATDSLGTLFGQPLVVTGGDSPAVGGAGIVKTDIACANGVIHVIDTVLLPKNIVEIASGNDTFSTLVSAVKAAGLAETLSGAGPFTVFAPTNDAFGAIPEDTLQALLLPENQAQLASILTYHVVPGKLTAADVIEAGSLVSVQGETLKIAVKKAENGDVESVTLDNAKIVATDVIASNGVIHIIDAVVMPTGK
jgi:uncharacterized surface protein with fasciclin (FAS1) repeats